MLRHKKIWVMILIRKAMFYDLHTLSQSAVWLQTLPHQYLSSNLSCIAIVICNTCQIRSKSTTSILIKYVHCWTFRLMKNPLCIIVNSHIINFEMCRDFSLVHNCWTHKCTLVNYVRLTADEKQYISHRIDTLRFRNFHSDFSFVFYA